MINVWCALAGFEISLYDAPSANPEPTIFLDKVLNID